MNKLLLVIVFLFCSSESFSQGAQFNHKKYWYRRWRLKNYFLVMGDGPGMSLPFEVRNTMLKNK